MENKLINELTKLERKYYSELNKNKEDLDFSDLDKILKYNHDYYEALFKFHSQLKDPEEKLEIAIELENLLKQGVLIREFKNYHLYDRLNNMGEK